MESKFRHIRHQFPKLDRLDLESGRFYKTPEGRLYPSVTSVLGNDPEKTKILQEWRNLVGSDVADRISKKATKRGTALHSYVENFLLGNSFDVHILHYHMWNPIKSHIENHINNIHAIETQLYSDHLESAGTVDLIAEYDSKLSIIDIKTSNKLKYESDISHYFEQCAAYSVMFEEIIGIPITNLCIIMGCDESNYPVVYFDHRDNHIKNYIKKRKMMDNKR